MLPLLFSSVAPSPHTHHSTSHCCHGMRTGSAAWWCTHLLRCGVREREGEGEGKCRDEEMERTSRWERCRTGVVLRVLCIRIQQHMACQRTARLVMVISLPALLCSALHDCSASFPPPCSPSPPHDGGGGRRRRRREGKGAAMCHQKNQHTNVCTHTHWMQSGGCSRLCHHRTHTRTHAVGGHPSFHTTARRRGVATVMASLCCGGGVGHWQACMVWWPWSAAQLVSMDSTCAMPREERVCVRERESACE